LFDTHCHLNIAPINDDPGKVIRDSQESGVDHFLVPGVDGRSSREAVTLCKQFPGVVYSSVGIHPNYSHTADFSEIDQILIQNQGHLSAVGEIGLDYFRDYAPKQDQLIILEEMLNLANIYQLPICLHNRDAEDDLLKTLSNWYDPVIEGANMSGGVFHAFEGSQAIAEWGIKHGFHFGIGGLITFKRSNNLRARVKEIGLDHLLLETDSPYLTPVPHRGKQNQPKYLSFIVEALSQCLEIDKQEIIEITDHNAKKLFGLK